MTVRYYVQMACPAIQDKLKTYLRRVLDFPGFLKDAHVGGEPVLCPGDLAHQEQVMPALLRGLESVEPLVESLSSILQRRRELLDRVYDNQAGSPHGRQV